MPSTTVKLFVAAAAAVFMLVLSDISNINGAYHRSKIAQYTTFTS